jgi:uncharacterized protein (DUF2141 family)
MKLFQYIFLCIFLLISVTSINQVKEAGLSIEITDLRNNKGHVLVSLYKDGKGYPDEPKKAFRLVKLSIINNSASITYSGLPDGNYSIAILHDENDDKKMNKNFLGLPKEGYGFSNNVMGAFGPPSLSKASFEYNFKQAKSISIRARY